MVSYVRSLFSTMRTADESEFDIVWKKMLRMAQVAGVSSLEPPRRCGRQTQRSNVPAERSKQYFK